MIPSVTESPRLAPSPPAPAIVPPAAKNAKTGTATPADSGRNRCSKCSASPGPGPGERRMTGTVNPSRTPATVACTPDSWTSTQEATASGSNSHHERTRRCTSTANSPSGTSASASGPHASELV
jgi:hypothetical protein